jgi:hypothetical protein
MTRESSIPAARVYLVQSRHFTKLHRGFSFVLLAWAGSARRRAMAIDNGPQQGNLFGGAV